MQKEAGDGQCCNGYHIHKDSIMYFKKYISYDKFYTKVRLRLPNYTLTTLKLTKIFLQVSQKHSLGRSPVSNLSRWLYY